MRVSNLVKRLRVVSCALRSTRYRFSLLDCFLYLSYGQWPGRRARFPTIREEERDDRHIVLNVDGGRYY